MKKINKEKIAAYATAAGAALAVAASADASVIKTDLVTPITISNGVEYLDLNNDGNVDFSAKHWSYSIGYHHYYSGSRVINWGILIGGMNSGSNNNGILTFPVSSSLRYLFERWFERRAVNLTQSNTFFTSGGPFFYYFSSSSISSIGCADFASIGALFATYEGYYELSGSGLGYLGIKFDLDGDTNTVNDSVLGWIHISEVGQNLSSFTIDGWAYEGDPTITSIHIDNSQPIPEPSTLALFATGVAGLAAIRRRRRKSE